MYTKNELNDIYEIFARTIDISEELFDKAVNEYKAMGNWIDNETPDYKVHIYPQGSFALGTVVKPITDEDEYDLDLVCEFVEDYGFSAKQLKVSVVKPLLAGYKKTTTDILEKNRCWRVEYDHFKGFHIDVIPSYKLVKHINITDKDEEQKTYNYIGSNPQGYIDWFKSRIAVQHQRVFQELHNHSIRAQAEIDKISEFKVKTPLQKAIQILKRHRNIMFANDENHCSPVSIIITTIAAQVNGNEDNIFDSLSAFLLGASTYINNNIHDGQYYIDNPSYTGEKKENFADKWNEHPERATAFFNWLNKAKKDLLEEPLNISDRIKLAEKFNFSFGNRTTSRVFSSMAEDDRKAIQDQSMKIVTASGTISKDGTVKVPKNSHYGR